MHTPIAVGIVGLGRSGRDIHGAALSLDPRYRIVAVADRADERTRAAAQRWGCRTYAEAAQLFADPTVELVIIATPSSSHATLAIAALHAGKAVLVDKPIAATLADADRVIAAAHATGQRLAVFQNRRFDADFLAVRAIIDSGRLGTIHYIRRAHTLHCRRTDWQALTTCGGGMLNNWGVHLLDQALQLLEYRVDAMHCDARLTVSAGDAEDQVLVTLRGAFPVSVEMFSACAIPQPEWLVVGSYGTLVGDRERLRCRYCVSEDLAPLPLAADIPAFADYIFPEEDIAWREEQIELPPSPTLANDFYARLYPALCGEAPLPVTAEESRAVLELIARCRATMQPSEVPC
ncbi:MAG TPA: Gfo/Idh/MocA family oxidoreductase [Armatimonadota bacterium]|jgi:predicted dehydrogenase